MLGVFAWGSDIGGGGVLIGVSPPLTGHGGFIGSWPEPLEYCPLSAIDCRSLSDKDAKVDVKNESLSPPDGVAGFSEPTLSPTLLPLPTPSPLPTPGFAAPASSGFTIFPELPFTPLGPASSGFPVTRLAPLNSPWLFSSILLSFTGLNPFNESSSSASYYDDESLSPTSNPDLNGFLTNKIPLYFSRLGYW